MTENPLRITDEQLDRFLDGTMEIDEREAFENKLRDHSEFSADIQLQKQIDKTLKKIFPPSEVPEERLNKIFSTSISNEATKDRSEISSSRVSKAIKIVTIGLAASLIWVLVGWQLGEQSEDKLFFQSQAVTVVYQETVDNGFEPYYECREEDRFANTFLRRQGKALILKSLPIGSKMLGLSYPGGLSRDTTAMLCEVDGLPVMVFVDRLTADGAFAEKNKKDGINVFRVARDGLVFYEVTPFETARVVEYLALKES